MSEPLLDRQTLEQAFTLLAQRLSRRGAVGEIHVFGGAAMVLAFEARPATRDVDALFLPDGPVDDVVALVERYFPDEPLSDRSRQLIEDLIGA